MPYRGPLCVCIEPYVWYVNFVTLLGRVPYLHIGCLFSESDG
jgi:hypothetical protein